MRLSNKTALVTGAGKGLGRAIAERFAEEGAKVVINDINGDNAKSTAEAIAARGGHAVAIRGDVCSEADAEKAVTFAVETFGGLDILVNNAGIDLWKPFFEMTVEEWDRIMAVNLRGVFLMSKHGVRQMFAQDRGGSIIQMSSAGGLVANPPLDAYCASKAGIIGLTRCMAVELRPKNIRVNALCPSYMDTDLSTNAFKILRSQGVPVDDVLIQFQGRLGKPEDVANFALFLASDESSFISGTAIPIDNGCTAQ